MDEFGYLYINGRFKDMIIRGGENIYPKVIEDFLNETLIDSRSAGMDHKKGLFLNNGVLK